jgi:hypothetical protein
MREASLRLFVLELVKVSRCLMILCGGLRSPGRVYVGTFRGWE